MSAQAVKHSVGGRTSLLFVLSGAFLWSWTDQCAFGSSIFSLVDANDATYLVAVSLVASVVGLIVARFLAKSSVFGAMRGGLGEAASAVAPVLSLPCAAIAAAVGVGDGVLCRVSLFQANPHALLALCGVALIGFSMGMLLVAWGAPLVVHGVECTLLHLSGSWAAGLPVNALFLAAGPESSWVLAAALPAAWMFSYAALMAVPQSEALAVRSPSSTSSLGGVTRFALMVLFVCGLFGFMTMSYEPPATAIAFTASGMDAVFARCLTALAAFAAFLVLSREHYPQVFVAALSFLALGAIALTVALFSPVLQLPARLLVAVGYAGFDLLAWAVISRSAQRDSARAVHLISLVIGAQQIGIALGAVGNIVANRVGINAETMAVLLVVANYLLLLATYLIVRRYADKIMNSGAHPGSANVDANARLLSFAAEHGLTARETDVLELLAEGRSVPYIAEKFVVSENTVKSHVRHIYEKCGFHNRQELLDALREKTVN